MNRTALHVEVHHEEGVYWAQVRELPGCFASGNSVSDLFSSIEEAISLYLTPNDAPLPSVATDVVGLELSVGTTGQPEA